MTEQIKMAQTKCNKDIDQKQIRKIHVECGCMSFAVMDIQLRYR